MSCLFLNDLDISIFKWIYLSAKFVQNLNCLKKCFYEVYYNLHINIYVVTAYITDVKIK